ncbi:hypothetical protein GCM10011385_36490 [Nitratireductor aestuarii]|uniref:EthD domain-containing protein n=1 Tax=Nitratireductor aestuarii TaxID=1735103 RepID=A0A916W934_9HYPH|nr:EthD domain-containing protein [Nitratireductor aestuarii]GGA79028.1 hypothetical protein GCM10011385_36490 [Nitratireductor aestuarii]
MINVIFCVYKRPEMSDEEFREFWWESHGPFVKARSEILRMKRYVQMPRLLAPGFESVASARGAPEPFDGIAMVSWESMDELKATFTDPAAKKAARELLEDERRFIDFSRSPIFFTEEKVVVWN